MTTEGSEDRYLLYLDILGFSEIVKNRRAEDIYQILNQCVEAVSELDEGPLPFSSLYFSDTVVFWHRKAGVYDVAFIYSCVIACKVYCELLAKRIPVRGAISYGQFSVRPGPTGKREIFFGKALIEAYEAQRSESWLGIVVCESAWKPDHSEPEIEALARFGIWRRRKADKVLLLNPFYRALERPVLRATEERWAERVPRLLGQVMTRADALGAFRFLMEESRNYSERGDFSGREAVKYHATLAFLREVLGPERFSEMEAESQQLPR